MALALLRIERAGAASLRITLDIGSNQYFRLRTGGGASGDRLTDLQFQTQVLAAGKRSPLASAFTFELPLQALEGSQHRFLQLVSYASKKGDGYARSRPVRLPFTRLRHRAKSFTMNQQMTELAPTRREDWSIRERGVSEAMFWGGLLKALPDVLKVAGPIVGQLLGKKGGTAATPASPAGGNAPAAGNPLASLLNEETINAILDVIKKIGDDKKAVAQSVVPNSLVHLSPSSLMALGPILEKIISPEAIRTIGDDPLKLYKAIGDAIRKIDQGARVSGHQKPKPLAPAAGLGVQLSARRQAPYARAQVAPALLAALPALLPLVEKLLDPKLINSIGDQPVKVINAVSDGVLKFDKQSNEHIERMVPSVDDPSLDALMSTLSIPSSSDAGMHYRHSTALELTFREVQTISVGGRERVLYASGRDLAFPFSIAPAVAPKSSGNQRSYGQNARPKRRVTGLAKAIAHLIVQDGDTMKVLVERKFRLRNVTFGTTVETVRLSAAEAATLPREKNLKVELNLLWPTRRGDTLGTFKSHYIRCSTGVVFAGLGSMVGQGVPLNDLTAHRPFWHKVWQGGFSSSRRWEINFDLKYYYALALGKERSAKLETRYRVRKDNATREEPSPRRRKLTAQLKGGFRASPTELNKLLPALGHAPLPKDQLAALQAEELGRAYNQVVRQSIHFNGGEGDSVTLWVYPEVSVREIQLLRLGGIDRYGQFTTYEPLRAVFPQPTSLHLIGTKSN